MSLLEFLNTNITRVEYYAAKKPKYNKEERNYFFENDTLVCLNPYDQNDSLLKLSIPLITLIKEELDGATFKDYTNTDVLAGIINVDKNVSLFYNERLISQLCSLSLIESERVSFNFMLIKLMNDDLKEALVWVKLKSPLKVENNIFINNHHNYQLSFTKDGITFDNYPMFNLDISLTSFILYDDEFYIIDKELYQKYFNLDSYYLYEAGKLVYNNNKLISDGEILTKSNAKFIYDYFSKVEDMLMALENEEISNALLIETMDTLNLSLSYQEDSHKFVVKKPQDLKDLILLSSGCLGINKLTNSIFKIKNPNYLEDLENN